jgi:hypothetical protein
MKTAWFNKRISDAMLNSGFKPLPESDHFPALEQCFQKVEGKTLLDLGCGIAEAALVFKDYDYTGADLPHIIDNAAKIKNPQASFIYFNADQDSYELLRDYDIILMNSFVSELTNWYRVLNSVLLNARRFIILHRQEITDEVSRLEDYKTYAGLQTTKSIINYEDLNKLFYFNQYEVVFESNSFPQNETQKTFVLRKNNDN